MVLPFTQLMLFLAPLEGAATAGALLSAAVRVSVALPSTYSPPLVSGTATVTLNGESFQKVAGETVDVAIGDLHRISNEGSAELVFIEVQTGTYFGEDDIERIEDDYSR